MDKVNLDENCNYPEIFWGPYNKKGVINTTPN